jgi:uncharacterized protein (TIGR03437 family)
VSYCSLLSGIVCLLGFPPETFAAQLAVDSLNLSPGGGGTIAVAYSATGDQVSALQFDIEFDSSAFGIIAIPGSAIRSAGKNFYSADLGPGSLRILLAGLNRNSLTDGPILTLFVNVLPTASQGSYSIVLTNALGADPAAAAVTISCSPGTITIAGQLGDVPALQGSGILNSASLLPGPVSPGEAVTLIGAGIGPPEPYTLQVLSSGLVSTVLSNTTVSFDSVQAPLLYADLNQINAVVPFEISGKSSTLVTISRSGQKTTPLPVPVTTATPAIFTQDGTGFGQAAALNEDGSLNTPLNPADQGSIVTLYLTGMGPTNPPGSTGAITNGPGGNLFSTTATIEGIPSEVLYSGPAPGVVAGVSQVNLRIPAGAGSSLSALFAIQVGDAATQDGVALSLR